jgi:hypothetical protein
MTWNYYSEKGNDGSDKIRRIFGTNMGGLTPSKLKEFRKGKSKMSTLDKEGEKD